MSLSTKAIRSKAADPMNIQHRIFAAIGIGAFIICVLACRPSFSPDGKKVVFPVFDAKTKQTSVMLYDRETRRLESIFTRPAQNDVVYAATVWTPDGKHVVIATIEGEEAGDKSKRPFMVAGPFMVAVLSVDRKGPTRFLHVPGNPGMMGLYHQPPIIGKHMFLGEESGITRLDLETGEIKTATVTQGPASENSENLSVFGKCERLYYFVDKKEVVEIGTVDPETLRCQALLEIGKNEGSEFSGFPAVTKDGTRIALAVGKENQRILIYRGGVLEGTLAVGTTDEPINIGNLLWSSDEKLIYAAHLKPAGEGKVECGFCEIPLSGAKLRKTPLCVLEKYNAPGVPFEIALSPDGKCIAASTANFVGRSIDVENPALYLVDLTRAKRPVTKIPVSKLKSVKSGAKVP